MICGSRLAYTLWFLGCSASASAEAERAICRARRVEHPFSLAYALNFAAWLANEQGNAARARAHSVELATIADAQELGVWRPMSRILLSYFDVLTGANEAIAGIQDGIQLCLATDQKFYHPYALALLARAEICLERSPIATLDEALAEADATGEQFFSAELLRLKGECLLRSPDTAAELFSQSTTLARAQGSPILEMRALLSLMRVSSSRSLRARIARLLARFPEQLDEPDIAPAKEFLK